MPNPYEQTFTVSHYTDAGFDVWAAIRSWKSRNGADQHVLTWHDNFDAAVARVEFWASVFNDALGEDFAADAAKRFVSALEGQEEAGDEH